MSTVSMIMTAIVMSIELRMLPRGRCSSCASYHGEREGGLSRRRVAYAAEGT